MQTVKHSHVRRMGRVVTVRPKGSLTGGDETDEIKALIDELDREQARCVVVNLADVSFMSSLALAALINGHVRFSRRGAHIHLCHVDARINQIFVITKLSLVFDVYPDEEAAIAGCVDKPAPPPGT